MCNFFNNVLTAYYYKIIFPEVRWGVALIIGKLKKSKCPFFLRDIPHRVYCMYVFVHKGIVYSYRQVQIIHTFPFFDVPVIG
jgi:hypothetical protein